MALEEEHVADMLGARLDRLLRKIWLCNGFKPRSMSKAVEERAAADLPASLAEVKAIKLALCYFPLPSKVNGLRLRVGILMLEERLAALSTVLKRAKRTNKKQRLLRAPASAAAAVLNDEDLLARIMSCTDTDRWLYTAPISRAIGAAYMTHVTITSGIRSLFLTNMAAALQSPKALAFP